MPTCEVARERAIGLHRRAVPQAGIRAARAAVDGAEGLVRAGPAEAADIRRPVFLEVEYEVLEGGRQLIPNLGVYNEEAGR